MKAPALFPTPLPDEALYSILCRFHVRSCNATDNATLHQLFDHKRSLHTTVLSPFPLRFAGQWTDSFTGINRESLIKNNTAFPFYRSFYTCSNSARSSYAADRFFMAMYNNCSTYAKKLRFCPKCAKAQWQNFGVSYWQILPQINGYEVCPIHKELIRETNISHWDIRYNSFPASDELGSPKYCDNALHLQYVEEHFEDFLQAARDISYLFHYANPCVHLGLKMQQALQHDLYPIRKNWVRTLLCDPVLKECGDETCLDVLDTILHDSYQLISQIRYAPVCLQLRACRALFGDIEQFCNANT